MNRRFNLFASDYVKGLASSSVFPSKAEFSDRFGWVGVQAIFEGFKDQLIEFLPEPPSFQEFIERVRTSD